MDVVTGSLTGSEERVLPGWVNSTGPGGILLAAACWDVLSRGIALPLPLCWHETGEARSRIRVVFHLGPYLSLVIMGFGK